MASDGAIAAALQACVDRGEIAGAATAVWRQGQMVDACAVGRRDIAAGLPVAHDTIFRIASLTKPVTSLAALQMIEEGRLALDDPVARWAPEFAHSRVLNSPDGPLDDTAPAHRAITIEDLLTHRSGLTYGAFHAGPIAQAYARALGGDIDSAVAPDDWIAAAATLPLIDQPGAGFHYGRSTDLLGLLLARIDGAPLGEVLRRRVFDPLGMTDTGFAVPPGMRDRASKMYGFDDTGAMVEIGAHPAHDPAFLADRPADMTYESGGQGLWSTCADYLAVARVFVEGGRPLLRRETLDLMTANRLTPEQRDAATMLGLPLFSGHGFGLGVAVVLDPDAADPLRCRGGIGTVGWPGAYGSWWQADPTTGTAMVFLAHNALDLEQAAQGIGLGVYGAIATFHALATEIAAAP
jgi:CubicO group peptidase (beta-lactamase class C family)